MASSLLKDFSGSLKRPDHWLYASWLAIVTSTRRNFLGIFWLVFPPIVYIWGIGWFIGMLNPGKIRPFMAHVGVSFVLFRLIIAIINDSAVAYRAHAPYINDGQTRYTDYILAAVSRGTIVFLFAVPVLAVALLTSEQFVPAGMPLALAGLAILLLNALVWAVPFSILGARLPDLAEFLGNLTMMLFLITPIVWYPSAAPEGSIQGMLMRANPLHHMIAAVRDPLVGTPIEPLTWTYLGAMSVAGVLLAWLSYRLFAKRIPMWI